MFKKLILILTIALIPASLLLADSNNSSSPWLRSGTATYYSNGVVGIGTTSAIANNTNSKLNIYAPTGNAFFTLKAGNTAGGSQNRFISDDAVATANVILLNSAAAGTIYSNQPYQFGLTNNGSGGIKLDSTSASGNLYFATNSTERMRINSVGNIGIGTSAPISVLDVTGQVRSSGAIRSNGMNTADNSYTIIQNQGAYTEIFDAVGNSIIKIPSSGNVGIGSTTPGAKLDVQGTIRATGYSGVPFVPQNIQVFTTSGTWTRPAGVNNVYVKAWGAGGSGGGGDSAVVTRRGGGGGGGGYAEGIIAVTGNVTVTVGTGGTGSSGSQGAGSNGGNTTFAGTTTLTANGGSAGGAWNGSPGTAGAGGSASNGSINLTGISGDGANTTNTAFGGHSYFSARNGGVINPTTTKKGSNTVIGSGSDGGDGATFYETGNGGDGMVIVYY